jgi:phosphatidyl-myo-inositol dimannoside synthase
MKILMFLHDAFGGHGGIARNNLDVIDGLAADTRVARVVALPRRAGDDAGTIPEKVDWRSPAGRGLAAYLAASFKAMFEGHADLVLCAHIRLLPVAWLASLATGAPLWLMIFGIDAWEKPRNPVLTFLARRVDRVISISDVTTARFQSWARLPQARMRLLPCIVDLDRFQPGPPDPALGARYRLAGSPVIFTFGRLVSRERAKGMDETMEAIPGLLADFPLLVYLIGGDGPDRARLAEKAKSLGLAERVIFTGRIAEEEKVAHYRLADAYVMPSRGEGFGIVLLEAMACGLPALASRKDGGREALLDGKLGVLVDPDDPASVVAGIREVLRRPKGRPAGLDHFSVEANRARIARLLDEIAAR